MRCGRPRIGRHPSPWYAPYAARCPDRWNLAAEFRAYQEVDVHAKVAGYLKSITVDMGDRVQAGQVIATLEVPEFAEEFLEATAREKRSELDVVRARSEVNRAQAAYDIAKIFAWPN